MINAGEDIVTTHSLFSMADDTLLEFLQYEDYILIIDEVIDVLTELPLKKHDVEVMLNNEMIRITDNRVLWNKDANYDTKYNDVRDYALAGNLYNVKDIAFIWNFPAKIFKEFNEVYILTYLF